MSFSSFLSLWSHYNRHRYFSPDLGRYLSADPIGQAGGVNVFQYAFANPLVEIDPFGLNPNDKRFGLPDGFWDWYHDQIKAKGDPDLNKEQAEWWKGNRSA